MRVCANCRKGSVMGGKRAFLRSHYNPTKSIRKYPNLQWGFLPSGKKALVCAKCLKKIHKD